MLLSKKLLMAANLGGWELIDTQTGAGSSPSVTFTAQDGDLIVVCWASDTNPLSAGESGGILEDFTAVLNDTTGAREYFGYRVFSTGDSTSYSVGEAGALIMQVWRNPSGTIQLENSNTDTGFGGMPNPPALSVNDGDLVVIFGALDDDEIQASPPSGYSNGEDANTTATAMIASKIQDGADTINPGNFIDDTGTGVDVWAAATVSFETV